MQDLLRSRRSLVVSAAVVILCIIGFFLATASKWRPFLNNAPQPLASIPAQTPSQPSGMATQQANQGGSPPSGTAPHEAQGTPNAPATAGTQTAPAASTASTTNPPADQVPSSGGSAPAQGAQVPPPAATTAAGSPPVPTGTPTPAAPAGTSAASPQVAAGSQPAAPPAAPAAPTAGSAGTDQPKSPPVPSAKPQTPAATADASVPASPSASSAAKPADDRTPSFDILRVEPTGESVIAARGLPNADIALLDNGTAIAHATADASGQVAFLPPALKPGEHSLALSMKDAAGKPVVSSQSVAVSIPAEPKTAPMVALIQPNQPAAILSGPVAGSGATTPSPAGVPANAPALPTGAVQPGQGEPVAIRSVEVESMGNFYASGHAPPGSKSRIYLNDAYVATVTAGPTGNWSLRINHGMKPGHYQVRADQVLPDGKVAARAQVPFDYPAQVVASAATGSDAAKKKSEAPIGSTGAPSPAGNSGAPAPSVASPSGAASADAHGAAATGSASPTAGDAGAAPNENTSGVGHGTGAAGAAVAALGGTDGTRSAAKADDSAGSPSLRAGGGEALPPVTPERRNAALAASSNQAGADTKAGSTTPGPTGTDAAGPSGASSAAADKVASGEPATTAGGAGSTGGATVAGGGPSGSPDEPQAASQAEARPVRPSGTSSEGDTNARQAGAGSTATPNRAVDGSDENPTVVEELVTAKVVHGDSLWRISRHMLGHGIRYTQIYAANAQEIRDPRLIYPGQVFVLPQD